MTITELLAHFRDPQIIQSLTVGDKLQAGLITTILGMGITFSALIILQFVIAWMDKLLNRQADQSNEPSPQQVIAEIEQDNTQAQQVITEIEQDNLQDDSELIAVITTAIAVQLQTSTDQILIRNIEKIENRSPLSLWNQAGIIDQMNSRL